jgi:hypothetical protein
MRLVILAALFALGLAVPARAASPFADCTTPAFAKDAARDGAFQCVELRQTEIAVQDQTAYVRTLRDAVDDRNAMYEPVVMQAIETGLYTFSGLRGLRYGRITVIFMISVKGMEKDGQEYAIAHPLGGVNANAECIIRINTARHDNVTGDVMNELQNSVVHELFHCAQYWNWPAQMNEAFKADAKWWIEGTAELMGHVAYESAESRNKRIDEFHKQIQTIPLTKIQYPNFVFFSWVYGKKPGRVFDLIAAMPTTGGEALQRAALVKFIGDYDLGVFATEYVDGKIRTPDNAPISPAPYAKSQTIAGAGETAFELTPLTVVVQDVTFTGGQYMATPHGKASMFYKRKTNAPEEWQAPMIVSADGPCSQPKVFRFAGMAMGAEGSDAETWSLEVSKISDCTACLPTSVREQCVQGQWKLDNVALQEAMAGYLGSQIDAVQVSGFGGFNARSDGTHSFVFNKLVIEGKPADTPDAVAFLFGIMGTIDSRWGAEQGHMGLCYETSDAVMQTRVPGGDSEPLKFAELMVGNSDQQFYDYECPSPGKLSLALKVGDATIKLKFDKIGD